MTAADDPLLALAREVVTRYTRSRRRLATAESCTGGMIAAAITAVPGSSAVMDRGFVTYTNESKTDLLGVDPAIFLEVGAVSERTARAMAEGALARAPVDATVAVTGIAGPDGATDGKPVGLVHIACAARGGGTVHERHVFPGDRQGVRRAASARALELLLDQLP